MKNVKAHQMINAILHEEKDKSLNVAIALVISRLNFNNFLIGITQVFQINPNINVDP